MERFIPYHIDRSRLDRLTVRLRKGNGGFYAMSSDDGALEVNIADLVRALPLSEQTPPGSWSTEGADFVFDGEHYAVDTTTPVGATLLAMARFADHDAPHPAGVDLPSEFHYLYFAEATRMPESSRYHHVFFDSFGRKLQLFDCEKAHDSTTFVIPAGEWREVDRDRFEDQLDRALQLKADTRSDSVARVLREPASALEGLTLDHWLRDWLPGSLAAYQTLLRAEPEYANAFAIELVTDSRREFSREPNTFGAKLSASDRQAMLTLLCLPAEVAAWVRAMRSESAHARVQEGLASQLLAVQGLLREQTMLLVIILVLFALEGGLGIWLLHK
jgi:hypothetical protein